MASTQMHKIFDEKCSGSLVECLTQDGGIAGSGLTRGTALCP